MPLGSLQGPPGSTPQCTVPDSSDSELTSSIMSISPFSRHWPGPSSQNAGQWPRPPAGCSIEAVTASSPPAGAPTLAGVVWTRPEVHELPLPSAVMSRLPLPSRCTLLVELVIVSISPVPKLEPGPVSYIHWESMPDPDPPPKSSLKTVDQPDGGAGTASGAVSAPGAESAVNPTCPAGVTTAA